jgi:hypothetical protein
LIVPGIYGLDLPTTVQYGACLALTLAPLTILAYLAYRFIEKPGIHAGNSLIQRISSDTQGRHTGKSVNANAWLNKARIATIIVIVTGVAVLAYYKITPAGVSRSIDLAKVVESHGQKSVPAGAGKWDQTRGQIAAGGFRVTNGTLEKGGLDYILSSDKGNVAIAMKKLDTPFRNIMKVRGRIKSAVPSGTRNGFITFRGDFGDEQEQGAKAGILIGREMFTIGGAFVEEVTKTKPDKFDQGKVFDFDLTVNLKEKSIAFAVDGKNIASRMTRTPVSITDIGFVNSGTKTEFSDLQISGD